MFQILFRSGSYVFRRTFFIVLKRRFPTYPLFLVYFFLKFRFFDSKYRLIVGGPFVSSSSAKRENPLVKKYNVI